MVHLTPALKIKIMGEWRGRRDRGILESYLSDVSLLTAKKVLSMKRYRAIPTKVISMRFQAAEGSPCKTGPSNRRIGVKPATTAAYPSANHRLKN